MIKLINQVLTQHQEKETITLQVTFHLYNIIKSHLLLPGHFVQTFLCYQKKKKHEISILSFFLFLPPPTTEFFVALSLLPFPISSSSQTLSRAQEHNFLNSQRNFVILVAENSKSLSLSPYNLGFPQSKLRY